MADLQRLPGYLTAALLVLFVLWWAGSGTLLAEFGGDNAIYFLTANHYSPYGTSHPAAAHFAAQSKYPPLYPWVLAWTGGGVSLARAHQVTALLIVLAGILMFACARRLGLSARISSALLLLCAFSRITLLEGLELHSEHLYLLLWLAAVALLAAPRPGPRALYLAALAIVGAYLTRTFGLTLVASFLVWLAIKRPAHAGRAATLVLAPVLWWSLLHHGSSQYLQDMLALYARDGIAARLSQNLAGLWPAWQGCFGVVGQAGFFPILPAILGAVAALGVMRRLVAGAFDAWSILAYFTLMLAWPYTAEYERMFYVLLPLLLMMAMAAVEDWGPPRQRRFAAALLLIVLTAAIAPFALLVQSRLANPPQDSGFKPYLRSSAWFSPDPLVAYPTLGYQRAITEALMGLAAEPRMPKGACLRAIKAPVAALYSGLEADGMPAFEDSSANTLDNIAHGRCRFLFMTLGVSPSFPQPYFPYDRLRKDLRVLKVYPNPLKPDVPAAVLATLREPVTGK